ncbi:ANTH domain-containing protein [Phycomyces nitens]|nr:ANTH domain-containing protein [Phycomyces nitens]
MEIAVRKATRLDYQPPKQKHLSTLISLTFQNPALIADMMDLLERRLRENSWIIVFKVLIITHVLMRDGNNERMMDYMAKHPSALDTSRLREKSSGVIQIQHIYVYTAYLAQRVAVYRELNFDHIQAIKTNKEGRLRHLTVAKGLLRETIAVQKQVSALLKCKFHLEDTDNSISLFATRFLVEDLVVLFQVTNEGVVNILEHYFAMSKHDARASLEIYKRFARQTEEIIEFLNRARHLQSELQMSIPAIKHAPLSLAEALEEYLNDTEREGVPKQETPKVSSPTASSPKPSSPSNITTPSAFSVQTHATQQQKQHPTELIDFFSSLEKEQTTVYYNQTGQALFNPSPTTVQSPQGFSPGTMQSQHNPFRATMVQPQSFDTLTNMTALAGPLAGPLAQSPATISNANPFRSNTLPPPSTQNSLSVSGQSFGTMPMSSSIGSFQGLQAQMTGMPVTQSSVQRSQTFSQFQTPATNSQNSFNPFAHTTPQTTLEVAPMNPFGHAHTLQPLQQQTNMNTSQWGSSTF